MFCMAKMKTLQYEFKGLTLTWPKDINKMCNPFKNVVQNTCDKAAEKYIWLLNYIRDRFKTEEMCKKLFRRTHACWDISLIISKHRKCVKGRLGQVHDSCTLSLIILKRKKCVSRMLKNRPMAAEICL